MFTLTQNRWKIDDVLGVWPLHGLCGAWGGIAAGIFGVKALGGMGGVTFMSQLTGTALGIAVALVYLMAGVLRLARFNITTDAHGKDRRTLGVPIPVAAGYAMAVALMRDRLSAVTGAAILVAMALLMVSRIRLPQMKRNSAVTPMLLLGIANYLAVVAWPNWTTVGWWNLWNGIILMTAWLEERRHQGEPDDAPEPTPT